MSSRSVNSRIPAGLRLRRKFQAFIKAGNGIVSQLIWAPDGQTLAAAFFDGLIRIWDADTKRLRQTLRTSLTIAAEKVGYVHLGPNRRKLGLTFDRL